MKGPIKIFLIETKQVYYQLILSKVLCEELPKEDQNVSKILLFKKEMMSKENNKKCEGNLCSF